MTESSLSALPVESASYVQAWVDGLAQVLGQIAGTPLPCVGLGEAPSDLAAAAEGDAWMVCVSSGALRGEMSLRLPPASVVRLAQIFTSEPAAPDAELTPEHREAAVELLRQAGGLVASALGASWGEVQLRLDLAVGAPSWPASSTVWLRAGEEPAALIELQLSAALAAALRAEKTTPAAPAAPIPPSPEQSKVKLDLLMDVELALTLRFGSRRLLLREVLDLNPGSVVDLDRQVQEPVDVLLDGRLVAQGEVVVLEGNYGVRITAVAPR